MSTFIEFPEIHAKVTNMESVTMPEMVTIHQKYDDQQITDVKGHMERQLDKLPDHESFKGKRICITVGSRGIPSLDIMVRTMCDKLKAWGAQPFIIPAMGSHGGGVAEGQTEMLAGYNITEESMGVPIVSCMDVSSVSCLCYASEGILVKTCHHYVAVLVLEEVSSHRNRLAFS